MLSSNLIVNGYTALPNQRFVPGFDSLHDLSRSLSFFLIHPDFETFVWRVGILMLAFGKRVGNRSGPKSGRPLRDVGGLTGRHSHHSIMHVGHEQALARAAPQMGLQVG